MESQEDSEDTLNVDYTELVIPILEVLSLAGVLLLCRLFFRLVRSYFPVKVNCWFCNQDTTVSYDKANSWDCPYCQQYNGFTSDGGYNKVIEEQHYSNNKIKSFIKSSLSKQATTNGLCDVCNNNSQLKIQQLAQFKPKNENNYDEEIESYSKKLDIAYRLCLQCQDVVNEKLQVQHYNIVSNRLNQALLQNNNKPYKTETKSSHLVVFQNCLRRVAFMISGWFIMFYSYQGGCWEFLRSIDNFIIPSWMKDGGFMLLMTSSTYQRELTALSLICFIFSTLERVNHNDKLAGLLFFIQHCLSWTDWTNIALLAAIIICFFSFKTKKQFRVSKPRNINTTFSPSIYNHIENRATIPQPQTTKSKELNLNLKETEVPTPVLEENKQMHSPKKQKTEPIRTEYMTRLKTKLMNEDIESETESNLSFTSACTTIGKKRLRSPVPEDLINGLHLEPSNNRNKNKSRNYLFQNNDFTSTIQDKRTIIKPSKFKSSNIRNWVTGGTWSSSQDNGASRSSTPSSGYMSYATIKDNEPPKTDNNVNYAESLKDSPPKSLKNNSPPNFLKISPPNFSKAVAPLSLPFIDHYDRASCYNSPPTVSNYASSFSNYPGPYGRTTVYTYTPPNGWYPPSQRFSPYDHMYPKFPYNGTPTSCDSTPSVKVNDSSFLFHNLSKQYDLKHSRFNKFLQFLHNAGAFLNLFYFFIFLAAIGNHWVFGFKIPFFQ